jgi:hypothetical protein
VVLLFIPDRLHVCTALRWHGSLRRFYVGVCVLNGDVVVFIAPAIVKS